VISPNKGSKISLLPPAPKTRPVIVSHSSSSSINQQSHEQQSQHGDKTDNKNVNKQILTNQNDTNKKSTMNTKFNIERLFQTTQLDQEKLTESRKRIRIGDDGGLETMKDKQGMQMNRHNWRSLSESLFEP
ncbi:MAG: hypothetical protein EZS28_052575, partial [Streblomastix strix]